MKYLLVIATSLSLLIQCDCYPSDIVDDTIEAPIVHDIVKDDTYTKPPIYDIMDPVVPNKDTNATIQRNDHDLYLIEGDIAVTQEQYATFMESGWEGLLKSEAWDDHAQYWPTTIPYEISADISADIQSYIQTSMGFFEPTCIRFVPKDPDDNATPYLRFKSVGAGCYVNILGMPIDGPLDIQLARSCTNTNTPAHEILHALGRYHEHTRPDRDDYVDIDDDLSHYLEPQYRKNPDANTENLPYDYDSAMHYPAITGIMEPVSELVRDARLGQEDKLSFLDIQHINVRYCTTPEVCFYAEPNYRGTRICKGAGETATFEDIDSVDMNDALSSVTVDCSLTVRAYEHAISDRNGGASRLYTGNVADLPDDFDNRISHFVVSALQTEVCFYEYSDYSGGQMCAGAGSDVRATEIVAKGLNDKFSSVSVPKGLQVLAHMHDHSTGGGSGLTQTFTEDTTDLGDLDKEISRFTVSEKDNEACFYENSDYTGQSFCKPVGYQGEVSYAPNPLMNNMISSIKVPVGAKVTAYDDDFSGSTEEYTLSVSLAGTAMDNKLSSYRVEDNRSCKA